MTELSADRAVLIRYLRDGIQRRGSGLRIGGRWVLTADHCANGHDHQVVVGGQAYPATVAVRSHTPQVDLAVLAAGGGLGELPGLGCARVDRMIVGEITGCVALGFPWWKAGGQEIAQVAGVIPTAEGMDPNSPPGTLTTLSMKITNQDVPDPRGDLNDPDSPWRGMSGAVVVGKGAILGVIRGHAGSEGTRSLILTPLEAVAALTSEQAAAFWKTLDVTSAGDLQPMRSDASPDPLSILHDVTRQRLNAVLDLHSQGLLLREAVVELQIKAVMATW
jgi:hypothetical protein